MEMLSIDIETYSGRDLTKCGVYSYTEDEDFEILLFGYAFNDERVRVVDLKNNEEIPKRVLDALTDENIIKTAFNANFEITCIRRFLGIETEAKQWKCTAVKALSLGLPQGLEEVREALGLSEGKLSEGKALIRFFSMPCKGEGGIKSRNLPHMNEEKWKVFKEYCGKDVDIEREIRNSLKKYTISSSEDGLWWLDQEINNRGVRVDTQLINSAIKFNEVYQRELINEGSFITGVTNPKSAAQLKNWLVNQGIELPDLSKETVKRTLGGELPLDVRRVLELRQELSKTSIKKYETMKRALGKDERIRGLLQFYGANRTGRWAGRLVQVQNLPQNKMIDLDLARNLLKNGEYEALEMLFGGITDVLSQLIRTAFIPSHKSRFIIADFSAIEARIIAWLAGEDWRIEVFRSHGKIYEASAAEMFKVTVDEVTKESGLREKGKIAELALGYQGSKAALIAMGALRMGLREDELQGLVTRWRNSNPRIVNLWRDVERAAIASIKENRAVRLQKGIVFLVKDGIFFIKLPSGRRLAYVAPRIERDGVFNKEIITYQGVDQVTKKWGRVKTYGGKLVENIVQGIARDCLAECMINLEELGYKTVMHIHDEVVLDVPIGFGSLHEIRCVMAREVPWGVGLSLRGECFESGYYKKE